MLGHWTFIGKEEARGRKSKNNRFFFFSRKQLGNSRGSSLGKGKVSKLEARVGGMYSSSGYKVPGGPVPPREISMTASPASLREERVPPSQQPQWAPGETRELIGIRGEVEREDAMGGSKSKKAVWEVVSRRMREKGHFRTPDQCKYKWKNLLLRYKGKEISNPESGQPCPFFEELHSVFSERSEALQQKLLEHEASSRKKVKSVVGEGYSTEFSGGDYEIEDDSVEEKKVRSNFKKRKGEETVLKPSRTHVASSNDAGCIQEVLKDLLQHQQKMEIEWMERMERRARERELFDQEWKQMMEKLERDRLMMEREWREREEQRRMREESRAEMRDALLTTLLNQLIHEK